MEINIKKVFEVKHGHNDALPWITGALFAPDDRIILADSNNPRILLYDEKGNILNEITLQGNPRDMVLLDDDHQLVITFPNELRIQFFSLDNMKMTNSIHIGYECFGITRIGEVLIVACGTHLITLDKKGAFLKTTPVKDFSARYICADDDENVYFTGWETDTIHSISSSGVYSIMLGGSLKYCRDLKIHDQSLLVVGRWSHNICSFTLDGKQEKVIMSKAHGLDFPLAFTLSTNKQKTFLVTNMNGKFVMICEMIDP